MLGKNIFFNLGLRQDYKTEVIALKATCTLYVNKHNKLHYKVQHTLI